MEKNTLEIKTNLEVVKNRAGFLIEIKKSGGVKLDISGNGKLNILIAKDLNVLLEENIYGNVKIEMIVENGSKVECISTFGNNFDVNKNVVIKDKSVVKILNVFTRGQGKETVNLQLLGRGAIGSVYSVGICKNADKLNLKHTASHIANNTESQIYSAFALKQKSNLDLQELVDINRSSENCNGNQKSEILVLSCDAKIKAIPSLFVANENVQCSHGVSITKFNEEKKFYLQSKGFEAKQAEKFLINEHVLKVLQNFGEEKQKKVLKVL
jgi:Fe-S cluster assembly scaffold protein SufB